MNSQEEIWKEKIHKLKAKITELSHSKGILVNLLDEKSNAGLNSLNPDYPLEIKEQISQKEDWIGFYSKKIEKYEDKLREHYSVNKQDTSRKTKYQEIKPDIQKSFKLVFSEPQEEASQPSAFIQKRDIKKEPRNWPDWASSRKRIAIFAGAFALLLLVAAILFLLKPNISGYAALEKESTYNSNLNLRINQSGNYTWEINKSGEIKSIRASGSFAGNGTVKIYIEKEGKRHLIFDNKKLSNAGAAS